MCDSTNMALTNREWLASLTSEQLASFICIGLKLKYKSNGQPVYVSLLGIANRGPIPIAGLHAWLDSPQEYVL